MMDMSELEQSMESYGDAGALDSDIFCEICNTGFRHMSSLRYHRKHRVCLKPKRGNTNLKKKLHNQTSNFLQTTRNPKCTNAKNAKKSSPQVAATSTTWDEACANRNAKKVSPPNPLPANTLILVCLTHFQMVLKCFSVRCVWKCLPPTPAWPTTSKGRCANRCKRKKVSVVPTRGGTDLECCRGRGDPVRQVRNGVQASDLVALPSHSQCLHQTQKRYHSVWQYPS